MPQQLEPVEHDPFNIGVPVPVEHNPFVPKRLTPADVGNVYVDPMTGATESQLEAGGAKFGRIVGAVGQGLLDWIETPGRAYREGLSPEEEGNWGAGTGLGMVGGARLPGGAPFGSLGSSGAKLVQPGVQEIVKAADMRHAGGKATADEIRAALQQVLKADDGYNYGLRVTPEPLKVGERAPPSKQFYADFVDEMHPTFGREAYPDHGIDLVGPSVIGVKSTEDIERALMGSGFIPVPANRVWGSNRVPDYSTEGRYVSLLRSPKREVGYDPGEWLLPNADVVATWRRGLQPVDHDPFATVQ